MNKKREKAQPVEVEMSIEYSHHFFFELGRRNLKLSGIGPLAGKIKNARVGERRAVLADGCVLVAEKLESNKMILVTGWHASLNQLRAYSMHGQEAIELDALEYIPETDGITAQSGLAVKTIKNPNKERAIREYARNNEMSQTKNGMRIL